MNLDRQRVYWCVPGILNKSRSDGSMDRVVRHIVNHTPHKALEFDYFAGPLTRRLFGAQQTRAEQLALFVAQTRGLIYGVGHSNGCDEWIRALELRDDSGNPVIRRIEELHLLSGAVEADWNLNGLARAMTENRVGEVHCYIAGRDFAIGFWARLSRWATRNRLGYGGLGGSGPLNVPPHLRHRVHPIYESEYQHSSWTEPDKLDKTVRLIVGSETPCTV